MNEFITIIEKTSIDILPVWAVLLAFLVPISIMVIPTVISFIVVERKKGDIITVVKTLIISSVGSVLAAVLMCAIVETKFTYPSGKYTYKVLVDKDNITVSQYEEFIETYKPKIKDGYYYFEYGVMEE
jgi:hypothetical protein